MKKISTLLVACFLFLSAFAGDGAVAGKVFNEDTGKAVAYANIYLIQDDIVVAAAITDEFGYYSFQALNQGYYNLEVIFNGYKKEKINKVPIVEQVSLNLNVGMVRREGIMLNMDYPIIQL